MPPPAPGSCFGRDELIKEVIGLAEDLKPIALTGTGGIGKTSIALSVLHHPRIETRFGHERRFIRCDEFPASRTHFLSRLSEVIGATVQNPDSLVPLRPFLFSKEMFIIVDNTESILDPQGANAREIYTIIHQLCQIKTICLLITSRIRTVPPRCARPEIPTLSMEAARDIFYDIYGDRGGRSDIIDNLLQRLDFHALSITLLATAASHNDWSHNRLAGEWNAHRAQVLRTDYDESLASSIELSLNSPTFQRLGPLGRDLLGVIAFFPHGMDEGNLNWLFPTIPDVKSVFDKFCVLSLTYRNNDFVTMLAPIRDYLCPQDPKSSPLLCATKDLYFTRLSGYLRTNERRLGEARWIRLEDVNVEHLLDVFTSIDMDEDNAWDACCYFLDHLGWHKPRETVLARKIEGLPDDHRFKPQCLFDLSDLFGAVGNQAERKRLLTCTLKLGRQRGCDSWAAEMLRRLPDASRRRFHCGEGIQKAKEAAQNFGTGEILRRLSDASRWLGHYEEGIQQAKEAVEIYKRLGDTVQQAGSLKSLAWLLLDDNQLDSAEATISEAIDLIPEEGEENLACRCHRVLGDIYRHKGEREKAIHHFETALGIASPFNWQGELFWNHFLLSFLFLDQDKLDEASAHLEKAKSHAADNTYLLGRATERQAWVWDQQGRLKDARSEAKHALEIYEKLGAGVDAQRCRLFLQELDDQ